MFPCSGLERERSDHVPELFDGVLVFDGRHPRLLDPRHEIDAVVVSESGVRERVPHSIRGGETGRSRHVGLSVEEPDIGIEAGACSLRFSCSVFRPALAGGVGIDAGIPDDFIKSVVTRSPDDAKVAHEGEADVEIVEECAEARISCVRPVGGCFGDGCAHLQLSFVLGEGLPSDSSLAWIGLDIVRREHASCQGR